VSLCLLVIVFVQYLHSVRKIHRDIKAANLLLTVSTTSLSVSCFCTRSRKVMSNSPISECAESVVVVSVCVTMIVRTSGDRSAH
jgi:serine/threonine protein kinase